MDEGTERPGLFAKGGVGRFLLLLTVGATLLVTVTCGGFFALMAGMEHFLPNHDEEIASSKNEGAAFASGHTVTECVTEAQARGAARCDALAPSCNRIVAAFARACVSTATDDGYCAAIPTPTGDDMFSGMNAMLEWQRAACTAFPPGSWCQEVMGEVHTACLDRAMAEQRDATTTEEASDVEPP